MKEQIYEIIDSLVKTIDSENTSEKIERALDDNNNIIMESKAELEKIKTKLSANNFQDEARYTADLAAKSALSVNIKSLEKSISEYKNTIQETVEREKKEATYITKLKIVIDNSKKFIEVLEKKLSHSNVKDKQKISEELDNQKSKLEANFNKLNDLEQEHKRTLNSISVLTEKVDGLTSKKDKTSEVLAIIERNLSDNNYVDTNDLEQEQLRKNELEKVIAEKSKENEELGKSPLLIAKTLKLAIRNDLDRSFIDENIDKLITLANNDSYYEHANEELSESLIKGELEKTIKEKEDLEKTISTKDYVDHKRENADKARKEYLQVEIQKYQKEKQQHLDTIEFLNGPEWDRIASRKKEAEQLVTEFQTALDELGPKVEFLRNSGKATNLAKIEAIYRKKEADLDIASGLVASYEKDLKKNSDVTDNLENVVIPELDYNISEANIEIAKIDFRKGRASTTYIDEIAKQEDLDKLEELEIKIGKIKKREEFLILSPDTIKQNINDLLDGKVIAKQEEPKVEGKTETIEKLTPEEDIKYSEPEEIQIDGSYKGKNAEPEYNDLLFPEFALSKDEKHEEYEGPDVLIESRKDKDKLNFDGIIKEEPVIDLDTKKYHHLSREENNKKISDSFKQLEIDDDLRYLYDDSVPTKSQEEFVKANEVLQEESVDKDLASLGREPEKEVVILSGEGEIKGKIPDREEVKEVKVAKLSIWKKIKSADFSQKTKDFLSKVIVGGYKNIKSSIKEVKDLMNEESLDTPEIEISEIPEEVKQAEKEAKRKAALEMLEKIEKDYPSDTLENSTDTLFEQVDNSRKLVL